MTVRCHKKTPIAKDVHQAALDRIREAYRRYDRVVVSFSGGKDSTVVLNLTLAVAAELGRLPVEAFHWDEEAIPPETVDYVARVAARPEVDLRWLCLPITHRNACSRRSPWWHPWAEEDRSRWCRDLPAGAVTVADAPGFTRRPAPEQNPWLYPASGATTCILLGIRTSESVQRYRAIATGKRGPSACFAREPSAPWLGRCYPVYDWTSPDVWLAPHLHAWDWNRTYEPMARAGVPLESQRVAPPYGEEPSQRLWMYACCWPDLWAKMCHRVPGACTAARYSRTELYGFGKLASPPPGMSWAEFVEQSLLRFEGEARAAASHAVAELLALHRSATHRPLPDVTDDPDSGLCWRRVAMIAVRGDLKRRRVKKLRCRRRVAQ